MTVVNRQRRAAAQPALDESAHVNRNLAAIAAALAAGVIGWWTLRGHGAHESSSTARAAPTADDTRWTAEPSPAGRPGGERMPAAAAHDAPDAEFRNYVAGKYRYLFGDKTRSSQEQAALRAALLERERVAVAINTARQSSDPTEQEAMPQRLARLAELDRQLGTLLPPAALAAFEVLKDSDIEQFQLDDYAGGIENVAPLSDSDKQSILYTKLVYRQRFRQVLAESGLMRGDLGPAERRIVFGEVSRALKDYRASYLQEVRQYLYDDEQYTLLANYENSEYTAELEKLRSRVE